MARNIKSLDPDLVAKVEAWLDEGILQRKIAQKAKLDIRWISDICVAKKRRARAAQARTEEQELMEKAMAAPDDDPEADTDDYVSELKRKLRDAIPIRKRVKAIRDLLDSPNAQLKKAGLDQLNAIEGIGRKGADKPYEPQPMFIIDTVPEFKPRERKKQRVQEADDQAEAEAEGAAAAAAVNS